MNVTRRTKVALLVAVAGTVAAVAAAVPAISFADEPTTEAKNAAAAASVTEGPNPFGHPVLLGNDKSRGATDRDSKVLGIQQPRDADRSKVIQWTQSAMLDQKWDVRIVNDAMVFINYGSGKALTVEGNSSTNGTNIIQWTYLPTNTYQQWRTDVDVDGDGYPNLRNVGTGQCLAIEGGGSVDIGKKAVLWQCGTGADQEWWFYPTTVD